MNWMIYGLVTALALTGGDLFLKLAAGKLPTSFSLILIGCMALAVGAIWTLGQRALGTVDPIMPSGILAGLAAGVCFSFVTVGMYSSFNAGAPLSIASPVFRLSGIVLIGLAGVLLFREPISRRYLIGLAMSCMGILLMLNP
jgi:drug/metabolite transporter (DMT)-like permease